MTGISSLERLILESLNTTSLTYSEIKRETGLRENICFNITQALIIRGLIKTDGVYYSLAKDLSKEMLELINGREAKSFEALELIESVVDQEEKNFRIQRVALDQKDEAIFNALLSNLESFLKDAHKKSHKDIPLKSRKVIFWGMENMNTIINQLTTR